jgi:hypothetical protein
MSPKTLLAVNDVARRRLLSVQDAAVYLGLSPRTLYNGTGAKSKDPFPVRPKRYGKKVLFDIRDLDKFCDGLSSGGEDGVCK